MRIVFIGTPDFAATILARLQETGHQVICTYSRPPRPAGRGKPPRKGSVHVLAEKAGIPVRTPVSLKNAGEQAAFADLEADIAVVAASGLILPQPVLDAPRLGCINLHASLLPRWRGAAPIQRAIMAGDAVTGVTVMQMEAGLDTGPILMERTVPIGPGDTAGSLHDTLAVLAAALTVEALAALEAGILAPVQQGEADVTYAAKIDKAEARIDWSKPAGEIDRNIRGLSPFPGAWCEIGGERVKILLSKTTNGNGAPGTMLDDDLAIAGGSGAVRLLRLQRAGKAAMDAADFLRGRQVPVGMVLG